MVSHQPKKKIFIALAGGLVVMILLTWFTIAHQDTIKTSSVPGWNEYTNRSLGIQFRYPATWTVKYDRKYKKVDLWYPEEENRLVAALPTEEQDEPLLRLSGEGKLAYMSFYVDDQHPSTLSIRTWFEGKKKRGFANGLDAEENIEFAGVSAVKINTFAISHWDVIYIPVRDTIIAITYQNPNDHEETYQEILASLELMR